MVVPSGYANSFNLSAANGVNSSNYTQVNKTGYNISQVLPSNARDVYGALIRNGESYRVFVLSVGNGSSNNALSSSSSTITLSYNNNVKAVTNIYVSDVNDYNDGRDMSVAFNRVSEESNISHYRVMVVPSGYASSFNLAAANSVKSSDYTQVNKTGYNISQVLSSNARDVYGTLIRNGESYRVFVLSVGNGSSNNALSSSSSAITLTNNSSVEAVTNISASDINDNNNGSDLSVTFNRVSNESNINHYRIMVVPATSSFNLAAAITIGSSNYTEVKKTENTSRILASNARDVDGAPIKNDISYKVYVLSVGNGSSGNALSLASSAITLTNNSSVEAVTNISASDINDNNNGSDLSVTFNRVSNESNINHYRIMVVPATSSFSLAAAITIGSSNYTEVKKTENTSQILASNARDVNGEPIKNDVPYKVYVLSVGNGNSVNALSSASDPVTLKAAPVTAPTVSGLTATRYVNSINVNFSKASDETNVASYVVMAVKEEDVTGFSVERAELVNNNGYGTTLKQVEIDSKGRSFDPNSAYTIYVLTVAKRSGIFALSNGFTVDKVTPIQ
jgi:hypothetical protein